MADSAAAQLHDLVGNREKLKPAFQAAWRSLPQDQPEAVEDWAAAAVELFGVNAGAACQLAFWGASAERRMPLRSSARAGRAAAEICRNAGAKASLACLEAAARTQGLLSAEGRETWWSGMQRLSQQAPDCVMPAASRAETMLADRSGRAFADLVAAGLKAFAKDARRRRTFFALEDPWALALLARRPGIPSFETLSRMLESFAIAVWGGLPLLRAAPQPRTRPSIAGRVVLLPDSVAADTAQSARQLYLAAVAHACAHQAQPAVRHKVGTMKPIEVALVTLIEDARVEALAMRTHPGLRQLWRKLHTAAPSGPRTAPNLLARLSRALIDPAHADTDGFVAKGRRLFAEAAAHGLEDPAISLRIGRLLGNDLGQMRVQFNWRDYVIEPAYRDDGAHLWESADQPASALDLVVEAAASSGGGAGGGDGGAGRARQAAPDERGTVVAKYPEWDAALGAEQPDWTTLRDVPARPANPAGLTAALAAEPALRRRIAGLVRAATIGQPVRLKRQPDGDDIDLDAALDAAVALRAGLSPDAGLFRLTRPRSRNLATVVMLDSSASTAARLADGRNVLDIQRLAVALLAEALDERRDAFALRAFASNGRDDVRLTRLKEFGERFDDGALARLAGLRPQLSTRLGTALRHARAEFAATRAWRRLLLVLTDGEPSDIDVADARDLVVDSQRAVAGLRHSGIDVFAVVLDPASVGSAVAIFGRSNAIAIRNLAELHAQLAGLYFRLARR